MTNIFKKLKNLFSINPPKEEKAFERNLRELSEEADKNDLAAFENTSGIREGVGQSSTMAEPYKPSKSDKNVKSVYPPDSETKRAERVNYEERINKEQDKLKLQPESSVHPDQSLMGKVQDSSSKKHGIQKRINVVNTRVESEKEENNATVSGSKQNTSHSSPKRKYKFKPKTKLNKKTSED